MSSTNSSIKLGIVGVGKIVKDQHLPAISKNGSYDLIATASRNGSVDEVAAYRTIEEMLDAVPELDAVALCTPPQFRHTAAQLALSKGLHVLLEKPPGATVSEVDQLAGLAADNAVSLYTTWHSRHGSAVEKVKEILADTQLDAVTITWKENVRKWHPNQDWIWQAGGLGVFDPGINGLSILTHILPEPIYVNQAELFFPENKAAPIAANIVFQTPNGTRIEAELDWRQASSEAWDIELQTSKGLIVLADGGASLSLDGETVNLGLQSEHGEYEAIYANFAKIINERRSDIDLSPLKLVADAFLLGDRKSVDAFYDE